MPVIIMMFKVNPYVSDFLIEFSRNDDVPGNHEPGGSD
jgi:hypothetical protein